MAKSAEFKLKDGKLKTVCTVTNINTTVTASEEDCHQSVQVPATELKISWELSVCSTPPPFIYFSQELIFSRVWNKSRYKTSCISAFFNVNTFLKSVSTLKSRVTYDLDANLDTDLDTTTHKIIGVVGGPLYLALPVSPTLLKSHLLL